MLGVTAAAVTPLCLAMAAGATFGPTAMHIALLPMVLQTPVAITVVAIVWRWSSAVVLPRVNGAYHMPRGRFAGAVLVVLAVLLGPRLTAGAASGRAARRDRAPAGRWRRAER